MGDPASQQRIVGYHGSHSCNHRIDLIAQLVHRATGILAADPTGIAGLSSNLSV
jgi:hypothetical protein